VVGDVTGEVVEAAAQRQFGAIPRAAEPPRPASRLAEPEQTALRRETAEPAQIGVIIGGYKIPEARSPDTQALKVAARILSAGESSRLHQRIVRNDRLGVFAGMFLFSLEEPGLLLVFAAFLTPDQAPKLQAALLEEVEKLRQKPVPAAELQKAKNQLAAGFYREMETIGGKAQALGRSDVYFGDSKACFQTVANYDKVTAADVQRVATAYFEAHNRTVALLVPERPPSEQGAGPASPGASASGKGGL